MQFVDLKAEVRQGRGKEASKKLRQKHLLPAVVYGGEGGGLPIVVNPQELLKVLEGGENVLIRLSLEGDGGTRTVILKELQRHPVRAVLLHADFQEISMERKITVAVPLVLVGEAAGKLKGGIVDQSLREMEVECLPLAIPDRIEVDVSGLDLGDSLHVRDLKVPEGVRVLEDLNLTVASVVAPHVEVVEAAVPEVTTEVAPEAEKAPTKAAE
ncbi:MAG: 50S ribosomal protein L25 [candidate division NC10 bacterium]|nr:50S ribosomal protein L25 [candidate division NC10 bacterium]